MTENSIAVTVLGACTAVLTGSQFWQWLANRRRDRLTEARENKDELAAYRDDLRSEIRDLKAELKKIQEQWVEDKVNYHAEIAQLRTVIADQAAEIKILKMQLSGEIQRSENEDNMVHTDSN